MTSVDALNAALAVEHEVIYAYGVVGAQASPDGRRLARAAYDSHRVWRDRLATLVRAAGGTAVIAEAAYALAEPVTTNGGAARLAVALEEGSARAYELLVVGAEEVGLRATAADALVACALRATRWRVLGGDRRQTAFPGRGD